MNCTNIKVRAIDAQRIINHRLLTEELLYKAVWHRYAHEYMEQDMLFGLYSKHRTLEEAYRYLILSVKDTDQFIEVLDIFHKNSAVLERIERLKILLDMSKKSSQYGDKLITLDSKDSMIVFGTISHEEDEMICEYEKYVENDKNPVSIFDFSESYVGYE
jgi:hypothetical protein